MHFVRVRRGIQRRNGITGPSQTTFAENDPAGICPATAPAVPFARAAPLCAKRGNASLSPSPLLGRDLKQLFQPQQHRHQAGAAAAAASTKGTGRSPNTKKPQSHWGRLSQESSLCPHFKVLRLSDWEEEGREGHES